MPSQEKRNRKQSALLWAVAGKDRFGNPTHDSPIEIKVRWETGQSTGLDPDGNTITIDATAIVNQVIEAGSLMWLGTLEDWYGTGSGGDDDLLMHVVNYSDVPDIKARNSRKQVLLKFSKDMSPSVE